MPNVPVGSKAVLNVKVESTYGTAATPADFTIPFSSCGLEDPREQKESSNLAGERELLTTALGLELPAGPIELEFEGLAGGQLLHLWNGAAGYTQGAAPGQISTAPTGSGGGSGHTLVAGAYKYVVAAILTRTGTGTPVLAIMKGSASSSAISPTSGQQVSLAWTDPTTLTLPQGWTYAGTAVYRTMTAGLAGTEKFLAYVSGTGAAYTDTGAVNTGATAASLVAPPTADVIRHKWLGTTPAAGVESISSFTAELSKDSDYAEQYTGCKVNEFTLAVSSPGDAVKLSTTVLAQKATLISNISGTYTSLQQFMGWSASVYVDGGTSCEGSIRAITINGTNGLEKVQGLCSQAFDKNIASGGRRVSGTIERLSVDHAFWTKVKNGTPFSLRLWCFGEPTTAQGCTLTQAANGIDAIPFPYCLEIDLFQCLGSKSSSPVSSPGPIGESIPFTTKKDQSQGTGMRIYLYNLYAAYA